MNKKQRKKRNKFILVAISKMTLISLFVGILIIAPTMSVVYSGRKKLLEEKMFGHKADYQGIVTLWNVDTFEGGTFSRSGFLESVAVGFEKKNKGAYIKVENLTIDEMLANIKMGKLPNLFSFGTGLGHYLEKDMLAMPNDFNSLIRSNFLASGMSKGVVKALAWCMGGYSLISTNEKIQKANGDPLKNLRLQAFDLAYDKIFKKSTKHINAVTFGKNDYVDALDVFSRSFTNASVVELSKAGVIDNKYNTQTPYDAYINFISGKSSVLLGTQRDLARMENRVLAGSENDYLYEPLGEYTDLVNYVAIVEGEKSIVNVCLDFIAYLLSESVQFKLKNIGMLSPTSINIYHNTYLQKLEASITEKTIVKEAF